MFKSFKPIIQKHVDHTVFEYPMSQFLCTRRLEEGRTEGNNLTQATLLCIALQ